MTRNQLTVRAAIVAGAVAAACVAGWFGVAFVLQSGIDRWVEDRRAHGWTVTHDGISMAGFPLAWEAVVAAPRLAHAERNLHYRWAGPAITLSWKPWRPRAIDFAVSGAHKVRIVPVGDAETPDTTVEMASGTGRMIFGPDGRLTRLSILLDDGTLAVPDVPALRFNRYRALVDNAPASNRTGSAEPHLIPSFGVDSEVFGLTLPEGKRPPLGRTIGRVAVKGAILGQIPPGRPSDTLAVWQEDGGTVEVNRLELGWGPLNITAAGTLALDSALQPIGALTGTITGFGETLEALAGAGVIEPGMSVVGKIALGTLARYPGNGGRPEIQVPVTLQNGWLFVGPIRLLRLPTIRWK